jgi:hypothetical protein
MNQVSDQVSDQVRDKVFDQVSSQIRNKGCAITWNEAMSQLIDEVWHQIYLQVEEDRLA